MTLLAPFLQQLKSTWTAELNDGVLRLFGVVNAALKTNRYVAGSAITSADISIWVLVSQLVSHVPLDRLPALNAWFEGISALPAIKVKPIGLRIQPRSGFH